MTALETSLSVLLIIAIYLSLSTDDLTPKH